MLFWCRVVGIISSSNVSSDLVGLRFCLGRVGLLASSPARHRPKALSETARLPKKFDKYHVACTSQHETSLGATDP